MRRNLALGGMARSGRREARPAMCLAIVILLTAAFWTGAVWVAQVLIRSGYIGL